MFTVTVLGMGRHGTRLGRDGEGSPAWQLSPPTPHSPLPPPKSSPPIFPKQVSLDRVRDRKTPSIPPLKSYVLHGGRTERALRVWLRRWGVGGWGWRTCQLSGVTQPSEAFWPIISGAWKGQRMWQRSAWSVKEADNMQKRETQDRNGWQEETQH